MSVFEDGNIVRLKYGSQKIMRVMDANTYIDDVKCTWFENGKNQTAIFSKSDLNNLDNPEETNAT